MTTARHLWPITPTRHAVCIPCRNDHHQLCDSTAGDTSCRCWAVNNCGSHT